MPKAIADARRLVIKIGSALLIKDNKLNDDWVRALAKDVLVARARGQDVVIISSGAIALGRHHLLTDGQKITIEQSQAAAAIGQIALAYGWKQIMAQFSQVVAQILITREDTENRRRYLNARRTIDTLLKGGIVPIINENDTIATQEIRYGDNDRLAAQVAAMISADCLLLLSDIDGLYEIAPDTARNIVASGHIAQVKKIDATIRAMASDTCTAHGRGGMVTKLAAAEIACAAGCHMVLASGQNLYPLAALGAGARHTLFEASTSPRSARKNWIASHLTPIGTFHIDAGAQEALLQGKSLLPIGVKRVEGDFMRGDYVLVCAGNGREIARGLSAYDSEDARNIIGHPSGAIEAILGFRGRTEIIHRDDLIIATFDNPTTERIGV